MHVVAVKIEELLSLPIYNLRATTTSQKVQTGRGERLVQEILSIFIEPVACFGVDILRGPGCSVWRDIEITFGLELVLASTGRMHRADFIAKAAGCQLILASIGSSGRILTPPPERGVNAALRSAGVANSGGSVQMRPTDASRNIK